MTQAARPIVSGGCSANITSTGPPRTLPSNAAATAKARIGVQFPRRVIRESGDDNHLMAPLGQPPGQLMRLRNRLRGIILSKNHNSHPLTIPFPPYTPLESSPVQTVSCHNYIFVRQ